MSKYEPSNQTDKSYDNPGFLHDSNGTTTIDLRDVEEGKPRQEEEKGDVVSAVNPHPSAKEANGPAMSYAIKMDQPNERNTSRESTPGSEDVPQVEEDDDEEDYSICSLFPGHAALKERIQTLFKGRDLGTLMKKVVVSLLAVLYIIYFIAVLIIHSDIQEENYWCNGDGFLILITLILGAGLFYFKVVKVLWGDFLYQHVVLFVSKIFSRMFRYRFLSWGGYLVLVLTAVIFVIADSWHEPHRLISLFGIVVLLLFGFVFSTAPRKVRWRHVAWGMALQFILGMMILRWPLGKSVFKCAGDKVSAFLAFTDAGSGFVFGKIVTQDHIFAFQVLSVILFFSFCIQILYYYGVMQWVVLKLGWFLQITIGTTACESVNAAANIFLGQTEAPLLIKPYLPDMTKSELHAVMTGGFATIAGSVLAAYISFKVDASHLLSASVMSAPAALAFAKLFYPETKQTKTSFRDIRITQGGEANLLHAAMVGVTNAIPLVANIAANLIAFYAFISFCSSILNWGCTLAGAERDVCTLESLFGWMFMPLAWVMGVEWSQCGLVGELIGLKTIVNEFVAYARLRDMKEAGMLTKRAEIIATYALCGFSNISSIGINLGGFGAMAPSRRADMAKVVVRAMIAGSCACFLTACIAGTLVRDDFVTVASNVTLDAI
ncbi:solute carrier family 28 member 3-like isoform X2 [Portunus trituberculatus]|uniref:solute carrier family 28 member 3-like isoform X2 n=1 Tax=Portunus trituberculatus TaxID=210409 RepID=UPI001E1CF6B9|nr:solute carrier family 28 member 3-like isoform X2 [Portunus trituberculatus]